ncbi:MAG TPA: hypothetical protein VHS07_01310 [Candidatus Binataceae bacterium]|jgi:hypothetical protein|nr:hypothetical protein [Candidatus Binataceae bacterium]
MPKEELEDSPSKDGEITNLKVLKKRTEVGEHNRSKEFFPMPIGMGIFARCSIRMQCSPLEHQINGGMSRGGLSKTTVAH